MRTKGNFQNTDWGLLFPFSVAGTQMDPNDNNISFKWSQSPEQTQSFVNVQTKYLMLHWEQGQQDPQSPTVAAHQILISQYEKT